MQNYAAGLLLCAVWLCPTASRAAEVTVTAETIAYRPDEYREYPIGWKESNEHPTFDLAELRLLSPEAYRGKELLVVVTDPQDTKRWLASVGQVITLIVEWHRLKEERANTYIGDGDAVEFSKAE